MFQADQKKYLVISNLFLSNYLLIPAAFILNLHSPLKAYGSSIVVSGLTDLSKLENYHETRNQNVVQIYRIYHESTVEIKFY